MKSAQVVEQRITLDSRAALDSRLISHLSTVEAHSGLGEVDVGIRRDEFLSALVADLQIFHRGLEAVLDGAGAREGGEDCVFNGVQTNL